jgi:diamine N-acetyltransferase
MTTHTITIRRASVDDAEELSRFAADVFEQTFSADNRREDLDAYLASAFSPARQAEEILEPDATVLLAEHGGQTIGYAHLRPAAIPDAAGGGEAIELVRLYVDRGWHGRGIAAALMSAALAAARASGRRRVWLGVWERNARAIAFYRKSGFVDVGSHTFVLGTDVQRDRLMIRDVDAASRDVEESGT